MKRAFTLSLLLILPIMLIMGWFHRYWIFDSYRLMFYQPNLTIQNLAEEAGMSPLGERLFFAAQPQLLLEEQFDQQCQFAELGLVLGCYRSADIFILDVTEEQLEPVEPVTAAHEMLHVVYARLSDGEESQLVKLLNEQYELVKNERVIEEIDGYRDDPDADLHNEMHSIFGTELANLTPALEAHYSKYFTDRKFVLAESSAYEKVFAELEAEIAAYDAELASLGSTIDRLESEIDKLAVQLDSMREELDRLSDGEQVNPYNALVPTFNSIVNQHNDKVHKLEDTINEYNELVAKRNANVGAKNNLIKSLDSNVQTVQ